MNDATETALTINNRRAVRVVTAGEVFVAQVVGRRLSGSIRGGMFRVTGVKEIERYTVADGVETSAGYVGGPTLEAKLSDAARRVYAMGG